MPFQELDRRSRLILANVMMVQREFPYFRFVSPPTGDAFFHGSLPGRAGSGSYQISLVLPPGSPDVAPQLYVWEPVVLRLRGGGILNGYRRSHDWHTLDLSPGGRVQICHTDRWDASRTYVQVLLKAALWLSAYHHHLETGKTIANFFRRDFHGSR